jgi:hypothetical protein
MTDSENIKSNFPFPILPRQPGLPDYHSINEAHTKGKANAASVASELGGGAHGLLGLTLSPATFFQLTGNHFVRPVNPGTIPTNVVGTAAAMGEIIRQHKEDLRVYRLVENTELALKSQLIDTFEDTYFRGLRNKHTGFFGVTYIQMIAHLYNSYGLITALDIIENEKRMDKQYDHSDAIEIYFDQIEDAGEFAEAGNSPFSDTQIVTKAFIQMFATGLYKDECRAWNKLTVPDRTWSVFKALFLKANKEIREMQSLTGSIGLAGNVTEDLMAQTSQALTTIATTTATQAEEVANVVVTTANIQEQLRLALQQIQAMQVRLTAVENFANWTSNDGARPPQAGSNANGSGNHGRGNGGRGRPNKNNESYCHTHGRTRRDDHTSATCQNPRAGHIATAALNNRQGGSNRFCGDA